MGFSPERNPARGGFLSRFLHGLRPWLPLLFCIQVLSAQEFEDLELVVSWNPSDSEDVAGYKVYYGEVSRRYHACIMAGNVPQANLPVDPDLRRIFVSVTAYDFHGNESLFSSEFVYTLHGAPLGQFSLEENYPNPFNPQTRIPFILTEKLSIRLAVYDILGREVRVLMEGLQEAGSYEVEWDGKDNSGITVASGVYLCRLLVGNFCQIRKLLLTH